jgi:hypothetical protein
MSILLRNLVRQFNLSLKTKTKLRGLSPRANNTDRATAIVGEVSANFCALRVPCGQSDVTLRPYSPHNQYLKFYQK